MRRQLFIDNLRWSVGALTAIIGAMMLVDPHQFHAPVYAALQPQLLVWGIGLVLIGVGFITVASLAASKPIQVGMHFTTGAALLALAYGLAAVQSWPQTCPWIVLGLATVAIPFLPQTTEWPAPRNVADLFAVTIALANAVTGIAILAVPRQFDSPLFNSVRPYLIWFGIAFVLGALALCVAQFRSSLPRAAYTVAHLVVTGTMFAFTALSVVPMRDWISFSYFAGFGTLLGFLAILPPLESFLRSIDPQSLQTRLVLALCYLGAIPPILIAALTSQVVLAAGLSASDEAAGVAQDITFGILLVFIVVAVVVGIYLARWLTAPMRVLATASNRLAVGDTSAPLPRSGVTEIARVARAFGEMRDYLATRSAQQQQLVAELDATISSIADGVLIVDPAGRVIRANAAARRLGYSEANFDARSGPVLISPEQPEGKPIPPEETPVARALRGETVRGVLMVVHQQGREPVPVSSSAAPIRTEKGWTMGAVVTFVDITPIRELQEEQEDLLHAVGHDLRSPLTVIMGQAQILRHMLSVAGMGERMVSAAQAIETNAKRMNSMIQDLVDSARLESGQLQLQFQALDLDQVIADLMSTSAGAMNVGRVRVEVEAGLPPVWSDRHRLERVLTNLIGNALKYSDSDSEVLVRAERAEEEVRISVSDRGKGIAPEELPHLFDRYYRASETSRTSGLGLGLYIARMFVEAHGGKIWAESQVGSGSTFCFTFPTNRSGGWPS